MTLPNSGWSDDDSRLFIDYGRYFVPEREAQLQTIAAMVPPPAGDGLVLELACGTGLLAETILQRFPTLAVTGLDGSDAMRTAAATRLAPFGSRFAVAPFDLAAADWRTSYRDLHAVVSSLAIHHLDGPGKAQLFRDLLQLLRPGGALIIADLVAPTTAAGWQLAADAWDRAVHQSAPPEAADLFARERWNMYRYFDPNDFDQPSTLLEQLTWLQEAGFVAVDVTWMQAGHAIFGGRRPLPAHNPGAWQAPGL